MTLSYLKLCVAARRQRGNDVSWKQLLSQYRRWQASLSPGHSPLSDQQPWVTFSATDFLKRILHRKMRLFEFGSGGSTIFFLNHAQQVTTVEHDPKWFEQVTQSLTAEQKARWRGRLIEPTPSQPGEKPGSAGDPVCYLSSAPGFQNATFLTYASAIDSEANGSLDAVLVDGRARPSCVKHAMPKVAVGGYLILDNAERAHYSWIHSTMNDHRWRRTSFFGPGPYINYSWQTTFWQRIN